MEHAAAAVNTSADLTKTLKNIAVDKPETAIVSALDALVHASYDLNHQQSPQTVTDFYYLLPGDYFCPFDGACSKKYLASILKFADIKNGYLRVDNSRTVEEWGEVALFKRTTGKYIVGISNVTCEGQPCQSEQTFLSYESGKWKNVTDDVLPKISDEQIKTAYEHYQIKSDEKVGLIYSLPQVGTTVEVRLWINNQKNQTNYNPDFKGQVLFKLKWNGTNFTLDEK